MPAPLRPVVAVVAASAAKAAGAEATMAGTVAPNAVIAAKDAAISCFLFFVKLIVGNISISQYSFL